MKAIETFSYWEISRRQLIQKNVSFEARGNTFPHIYQYLHQELYWPIQLEIAHALEEESENEKHSRSQTFLLRHCLRSYIHIISSYALPSRTFFER